MIPSGNFCFHLLWMHLCTGINIFSPSPHPFYILSIKCVKVNLYIVHFLLLLKKHGAKFNLTKSLKNLLIKLQWHLIAVSFVFFSLLKCDPHIILLLQEVCKLLHHILYGEMFFSLVLQCPEFDISGRHGNMYL